jgi:hypothetical protein
LNTKLKIFWLEMFIYAVSFCLVALGETKSSPGTDPLLGFACAIMALTLPFMHAGDALFHNMPLPYPSGFTYSSLSAGGLIRFLL